MQLTNALFAEISKEVEDISQEWASGKDISRYHMQICDRIEILFDYLASGKVGDEIPENFRVARRIIDQYYDLRDKSECQ